MLNAAAVVCMTHKSAELLSNLYEAPAELIHVILTEYLNLKSRAVVY